MMKYLKTVTRTDGRIDEEIRNIIRKVISLDNTLYRSFFNKK